MMQPKAIKLANASVMPVTTGFKVVRRVTTGNATARANSSTVIAIRYGLRPAGTAASSNSATCHTHEAATYECFPAFPDHGFDHQNRPILRQRKQHGGNQPAHGQ